MEMKLLMFSIILLRKTLKQISAVSLAILTSKTSFFPDFLIRFEEQFAQFCGTDYALSFCNGTSAIEAALFALGVGPGDEVIVPSLTFHASIDPICNVGAQPIFADVDRQNLTICPKDIEDKISEKTKAIIVVHIFGIPANMKAIQEIASANEVDIIEDASHAHGAMAEGKMCGSLGRIGVFSLQGAKAVAAGEGGMSVTQNKKDFLAMSLWGHFGRHGTEFSEINCQDFKHTGLGFKRRMAPLGALLAQADLDEVHKVNKIMNQTAKRLDQALTGVKGLLRPQLPTGSQQGGFFGGYAFSVNGVASDVIARLRSLGIHAKAYPFARHHQLAIYNDLDYRQRLVANRNKVSNTNPNVTNIQATFANASRMRVKVCRVATLSLSRSRIRPPGRTSCAAR